MRIFFVPFITLSLATTSAAAHPHLWVDAKTEVIVQSGKITAIRHTWTMDKSFSEQSLRQQQMHIPPMAAELKTLKENYRRSIGDFSYFTYIRTKTGRIPLVPGADAISFQDGQIRYSLTSTLSMPLENLKNVTLDLYDPSYYVAVTYPAPPVVTSTDSTCRTEFTPRPPIDPALAARFADNTLLRARLPAQLAQLAESYSNRLTLSCSTPLGG